MRKLIRLQKTKTVKEFPIVITVISIVMITLYTKANVDCISVSEAKNSAAIMRYQYWQYCKAKKTVLVDYLTSTHRQSFADLEGQRKKQMFCSSKIFTVILRTAEQMFKCLLWTLFSVKKYVTTFIMRIAILIKNLKLRTRTKVNQYNNNVLTLSIVDRVEWLWSVSLFCYVCVDLTVHKIQ